MQEMIICALQLNSLSMSDARIDYYLHLAKEKNARVVLFGEYILNSFFNDLKNMPKSMIKEQSEHKKILLCKLAKKYDFHIIAPIITIKAGKIYKNMAKFSPNSIKYKAQSILMPYPHWNENAFFTSNTKPDFMTFSVDGFKFATLFGFEIHFDEFFLQLVKKKVDCLLVPTANALNSEHRWMEFLRFRAMLNNFYILRANRLGITKFDDNKTEFYGNSMIINPFGEVENELDDKEGMLVCSIDKKILSKARNFWKFNKLAQTFDEINSKSSI